MPSQNEGGGSSVDPLEPAGPEDDLPF
jgi:hypothetical protein